MVFSLAANLLGKSIQGGLAAGLTTRVVVGGIAGAALGGDEGLVKGAVLGAIAPGARVLGKGLGMSTAKLAESGLPVLGSGKFGRRLLGAGAFGAAGMGIHSAAHDPNVRELYESRYGVGPMTDMRVNAIEGLGTAAQGMGLATGGATLFGLGPLNIAAKGLGAARGGLGAAGRGLSAAGRGLGAAGRGTRNFSRGLAGMRDVAPRHVADITDIFEASSRGHVAGSRMRKGIKAAGTGIRAAASSMRRVPDYISMQRVSEYGPRKITAFAKSAYRGFFGMDSPMVGFKQEAFKAARGATKGTRGSRRAAQLARREATLGAQPYVDAGASLGAGLRGAPINAGIKGIQMGQSVTAHAQRWAHSVMRGGSSAMSAIPGAALGTTRAVGGALAGPFMRHPNLTAAGGGAALGVIVGGSNAARRNRGKNFPEGTIRAMRSAPRGGIHPALNFSTQGLTLRTHNRRKRRVLD